MYGVSTLTSVLVPRTLDTTSFTKVSMDCTMQVVRTERASGTTKYASEIPYANTVVGMAVLGVGWGVQKSYPLLLYVKFLSLSHPTHKLIKFLPSPVHTQIKIVLITDNSARTNTYFCAFSQYLKMFFTAGSVQCEPANR